MPNPGHPSRGCTPCRRMKVKCDELRPACSRCTRAARPCTGYPSAMTFRHTTQTAGQRATTNSRAAADASGSSSPSSSSRSLALRSHTTSRSRLSRSPLALSHPCAAPTRSPGDWTAQAVVLFFTRAISPRPDRLRMTWGFYEYLPGMYVASGAVYLRRAVEAASLALLANLGNIERLGVMARRAYGESLRDLRRVFGGKGVEEGEGVTGDEVLAGLKVLATYELIAGEQPLSEIFHAHFHGQATLLRLRGAAQFDSPIGRSLFATTNRILLWRDLADCRRPTLGCADWPPTVYPGWLGERSARLSVRVAEVVGRVREAGEVPAEWRGQEWEASVRALVHDVAEVDAEVRRCAADAPEELRPRALSIPPCPSLPASRSPSPSLFVSRSPRPAFSASGSTSVSPLFDDSHSHFAPVRSDVDAPPASPSYPRRIDIYPTLMTATLWNTVSAVHLHLLQALGRLSLLVAQHPPFLPADALPTPPALRAVAAAAVGDICASVPFLVGDVDETGALRMPSDFTSGEAGADGRLATEIPLLWTLHKVCRVPGLDAGLKAWVVGVLERLGTRGMLRQGRNLSALHGGVEGVVDIWKRD